MAGSKNYTPDGRLYPYKRGYEKPRKPIGPPKVYTPERIKELQETAPMNWKGLTERQMAFVNALKANPAMSKTEAALRAGYSAITATAAAHRLMKNPKVREYLLNYNEAIASASKFNARQILEEIDNLAMSNIAKIVEFEGAELKVKPFSEISEQDQRTIRIIEQKEIIGNDGKIIRRTRVEMHPKIQALELSAEIRRLKELPSLASDSPDQILLVVARETPLPQGPKALLEAESVVDMRKNDQGVFLEPPKESPEQEEEQDSGS